MFKTYIKLLGFAKPLEKYAIPYFFYAVLYAIFNTFNYAMIIPILSAMFRENFNFQPIYEFPELTLHTDTFYKLIDYGYTQCFGEVFSQSNMLIMLAVATIGMSLLSNVFRYLCSWTIESLRTRTVQRIRNEMFEHVMDLNVGYLSDQRKGDLISRITSDVSVVQYCITNTLQVAFREPLLIIGYVAAMIAISWQLSIFSVLFLPVVAFVIGSIVKKLRLPARKGQERLGQIVSALDESLSGAKVIKSYNATDYIKGKFFDLNESFSAITLMLARRQQLASPISEFLGVTAIAVIIIFGGTLVASGKLDAAQFMAFIAIFSQVTRPVRAFVDQFGNINQGIAAGERIFAVLETQSEVRDCDNAQTITEFKKSIEFRNVRFSYDGDREVINGVSFTINKGETVALVGPSGGGKSTLSELVPRFFDPTSGEILIDGVPLTKCTQHSLRSLMGSVAQDTILFNDSIAGNLRLAKLDATDEELVEATKAANAHQFIMESEEGYNTNIGDRGLKLSGGQRQRLSIARAILKNPDILILDEATSALDTESEKLVQESLEHLLSGRTSIVVAHRLSTIYNADKILVIDRGQLAEQGSHSELMAKNGIYAKLVEMQSFE
ncbi:MAG: ABC transporter ATP-binding protein [Rikenellaceae bacterium]